MRPFDEDYSVPFEAKVAEAARLEGQNLSDGEVAALKSRVRFTLMGANPDELTVAQLQNWVRRILPGLRGSARAVAGLFPPSLLQKLDGNDAFAGGYGGEILVSISGRTARFDPQTLVVTPLRVDGE